MAAVSHRPESSVCADFDAVIFLVNAFSHFIIIDPLFLQPLVIRALPDTNGNSCATREKNEDTLIQRAELQVIW